MRGGFFGPVVDSLGLWWILWACGGFFGPVVDSLGLWWIHMWSQLCFLSNECVVCVPHTQ